ncbi:hypothetical protein M8C21_025753 [Ambrosia artemisiifolia]|uniref:Uncharacterized protein n=1 Tax=Ambrosia artemisiifolia TaxID=4212 RepID=A0AAD5CXS0_AMBAR|nr:hypothetical protein M8C21_025753 [Ambrosia artemisiifolia]
MYQFLSYYDTINYYEVGIGNTSKTFWFTTPSKLPYLINNEFIYDEITKV